MPNLGSKTGVPSIGRSAQVKTGCDGKDRLGRRPSVTEAGAGIRPDIMHHRDEFWIKEKPGIAKDHKDRGRDTFAAFLNEVGAYLERRH